MKIGFAGAGSIATALARGWAAAEHGPEEMLFSDAGSGRAAALAEEVGGEAVGTLGELALRSDAILLAVKPAALESAAEQLGGAGDAIASVLAATPVSRLREVFPDAAVVRVMPTITTEVQRGVICHAPLEPADGQAGARLLNLFGELSHLVEVPDELMDAATAVMGCSPAYLAVVIQNIAEAGAAEGLDPELAYELVLESFDGTIELMRRYDAITVRSSVASRGGATEAGLEALADAGVGDGLQAAVRASLDRMRP
ncbi:MAG: pyrroline-5-carboxylate reductase [Solirubrobacterales bacterium]|jgi:pyrroline-5-carboxylate reductase|nr:pyrroline-5-carboxylate reductase [Solirubrobacterales bacterium]